MIEIDQKSVKIIIADKQEIIQRGVSNLIRENWNDVEVECIKSFNSADDLVFKDNCLLIIEIDLLKDRRFRIINQMIINRPSIKVLIFSVFPEDIYATPYLNIGVHGYVEKNASEKELIKAIYVILLGGKYISRNIDKYILNNSLKKTNDNPREILSRRELQVADELCKGLGTTEIATDMGLDLTTVSTYKLRLFKKLNVGNIIELSDRMKFFAE